MARESARTALQRAGLLAAIDVGLQDGDAVAPGIADEHLGRVKAHRLVVEQGAVELGRVVGLEVEGLVGHQGKGGGVGLAEAKPGKALPTAARSPPATASSTPVGPRPGQKALAQRRHRLLRAAAAHRPAQPVGLGRREAGDRHRHPDHLLLEDDHAQRLRQRPAPGEGWA